MECTMVHAEREINIVTGETATVEGRSDDNDEETSVESKIKLASISKGLQKTATILKKTTHDVLHT